MAVGAVGVVSGTSNVFPEAVVNVVRAFEAGDLELARASQQRLNELIRVIEMGPPLAGCKAGLALRGVAVGGQRPPLRDMTLEEHARFTEAFEAAWVAE
jgi:4-hydroxy-tetrahydrodipicolinate synthase